jgi:hypothetical protein
MVAASNDFLWTRKNMIRIPSTKEAGETMEERIQKPLFDSHNYTSTHTRRQAAGGRVRG